jgi:hypothetical protein
MSILAAPNDKSSEASLGVEFPSSANPSSAKMTLGTNQLKKRMRNLQQIGNDHTAWARTHCSDVHHAAAVHVQ